MSSLFPTGTTYDPFGLGTSTSPFTTFVANHGFWSIYVRTLKEFPCKFCFDPETRSPDSLCAECFGLGYKIKFEKQQITKAIVGKPRAPQQEYGFIDKFPTIIYSPLKNYPKARDLYIEVEWNTTPDNVLTQGQPVSVISTYQISELYTPYNVTPQFFICGCIPFNFNSRFIKETVSQIGNNWA